MNRAQRWAAAKGVIVAGVVTVAALFLFDSPEPEVPPASGPSGVRASEPWTMAGRAIIKSRGDGPLPPWIQRYGPDYVAVVDTLRHQGSTFVCSGVEGLIRVDGATRALSHLGPWSPRFSHVASDGPSSRCSRVVASDRWVVAVHRGDAFLGPSYLAVFRDPARPVRAHLLLEEGAGFESAVILGDRLIVAMGRQGVWVYQISETGIQKDVQVAGVDQAWDVVRGDGVLYVSMGDAGLATLELSAAATQAPKLVAHVPTSSSIKRLTYHGPDAIVLAAGGSRGFLTFDVSQPRKPTIGSWTDTPGSVQALTMQGDRLAVADWDSVRHYHRQPEGAFRFSHAIPERLVFSIDSDAHDFVWGSWVKLHSRPIESVSTKAPNPGPLEAPLRIAKGPKHPEKARRWVKEAVFLTNDGGKMTLPPLQGKVVVLAYFATFCPPCFLVFPEIQRRLRERHSPSELQIFGVSGPVEDFTTIKDFRATTGVTFPFIRSVSMPPYQLAGANSRDTYFPFHLVIDRRGDVTFIGRGGGSEALEKAVADALDKGDGM